MLAATQRLRRSTDFAAAVRGGRRAGRGAVVVHLRISPGLQPSVPPPSGAENAAEPAPAGSLDSPARAGFVVSKAVGNAVIRNQVRRRLRHLVRARMDALPPGALLVVRALPAAAGAPSSALGVDLDAALAVAAAATRKNGRGRSTGTGVR